LESGRPWGGVGLPVWGSGPGPANFYTKRCCPRGGRAQTTPVFKGAGGNKKISPVIPTKKGENDAGWPIFLPPHRPKKGKYGCLGGRVIWLFETPKSRAFCGPFPPQKKKGGREDQRGGGNTNGLKSTLGAKGGMGAVPPYDFSGKKNFFPEGMFKKHPVDFFFFFHFEGGGKLGGRFFEGPSTFYNPNGFQRGGGANGVKGAGAYGDFADL